MDLETKFTRAKDIVAHDDQGNQVFPVFICTICPIQYAEEAEKIGYNHLAYIEKSGIKLTDKVFATSLKTIGSNEITHLFCCRFGYTNQVQMEVQTIASQNLDWCAKRSYSFYDNPEEIKSLFCCVIGKRSPVLEFLGLQKV